MKLERLPEPEFNQQPVSGEVVLRQPGVRQERTLAGMAIGTVRDWWDGGQKDAQAKKQRAKANDEMAVMAADTVAFLPGLKANVGGLLRGGLLWDPNLGVTDNLPGFGKNVLEGYALNKVGGLAAPQSSFMRGTAAVLGNGLKTAAAGHLAVGLGMGAVKTGFNINSWMDAEGNLSAAAGRDNLLHGSLIGGLVNIPAGMVGSLIGRAGTLALGNGFFGQVTTGVGAGWAGGCVFGGVDSVLSGRAKDSAQLWSDIWYGGQVGGWTGGLAHGLTWSAGILPVQTKTARGDSVRLAPAESDGLTGKQRHLSGHDVLDLDAGRQRRASSADAETKFRRPREFNEGNPTFLELNQRLLGYKLGRREFTERVDFTTKWKSAESYRENALAENLRDVRIYKVEGHTTKIVVPEELAVLHDELRELRLLAARKPDIERLSLSEQREVHRAVQELSNHSSRYTVLPEDCIEILDQLINRTYCKELLLENRDNPYDEGTRLDIVREIKELRAQGIKVPSKLVKLARDYRSDASATDDGVVTLFDLETSTDLRDIIFHEDAHQMLWNVGRKSPRLETAWKAACLMEKKGYFADYYAYRNYHENFAVHVGEIMQHQDFDQMVYFGEQAPLRAAIAYKILDKAYRSVPESLRGVLDQEYVRRIIYLEREVLPRAQEILVENLRAGTDAEKLNALKLLGQLGSGRHLPRLKSLAVLHMDPAVCREACDAAVSVGKSLGVDFAVLVELASPSSKCRKQALDYLESHEDPRADQYLQFLRDAGNVSKVRRITDRIEHMPDEAGSELAFKEALQLCLDGHSVRDSLYLFQAVRNLEQRQAVFESTMGMLSEQPARFIDALQTMMKEEPRLKPSVSMIVDLQQIGRGKSSVGAEARELLEVLKLWPGLPEDSARQLQRHVLGRVK